MEALSLELVFEQIYGIIFFSLLAFFTNWVAKTRGFFVLPDDHKSQKFTEVKGFQVVVVFAIYLISALFLAPLLGKLILQAENAFYLSNLAAGVLQLGMLSLILVLFTLFALTQPHDAMREIWVGQHATSGTKLTRDFFLGILTWFIGFPLVAAISQITDLLLYLLFRIESYEQVAVRFLKMALDSPALLTVALITIILVAPIVEEWLFRGFLQSFLRRHVGRKAAVLLTAISFALFHLSASQGLGNISLAISLFAFSCYLGFLYERQGSLLAPIGLHMAFNTISCVRILLLPS